LATKLSNAMLARGFWRRLVVWNLTEAREKLEEIVKRASADGPQALAVDGEEKAAIISMAELRRLQERKPTFKEFLRSMPSLEGVDLSRDQTPMRDIDL
jgi:prevent-host-death family protein